MISSFSLVCDIFCCVCFDAEEVYGILILVYLGSYHIMLIFVLEEANKNGKLITRDFKLLRNDVIGIRKFHCTQIVFKCPFLTYNFCAEFVRMALFLFLKTRGPGLYFSHEWIWGDLRKAWRFL
jgi:hypothetical protein